MILRKQNLQEKGKIGYTYLKIVKQLIEDKRIGTALKYHDSFPSIYKKAGNLSFKEIDVRFLKSFENWMVDKNGCSRAWVGSIFRHLRGAFNDAIEDGLLIKSPENYPFDKRRYKIPSVKKQKTAIKPENMAAFYEYTPTCPSEEKAKDYWFFMYFGNGMNPKDMCYIKWSDFNGQYISFIRAKSELTADTTVTITVFVNDDIQRIIEKWGNTNKSLDSYLFPILQPGMNELEQTLKVKRTTTSYVNGLTKFQKDYASLLFPLNIAEFNSHPI
ncbi:integrase [Filimonas zeae]|uniref:Phage integrase SAM-like domain-containing protein n=1 Tax=Filimonas zeae TaxID=1737353 RepID=A0A917MTV8_9BACT|nr:phage integrase SAM-like domain-containing protein [Filimonas zeae]MDR6337745.1 integrase [Filimonas zeae]GGH60075.1 hypothetical protein GCM10011379_07520 [Filimonas zeae]